jgi:hypothetical protein
MFKKSPARREKVSLMIALAGPSGSGKTYSALQLAYGITGDKTKICVADTENDSALLYAENTGDTFQHISFPPTIKNGYHPNNWIALIEQVEADPHIEVLILDSITHEWEGVGGVLDMQSKLGGQFKDWAKVNPHHTAFFDKMRSSRLHVIATVRKKTEYAMEKDEKGKTEIKKYGLKLIQRDSIEYEFSSMLDIDIAHHATTSKDRTGVFSNRIPFVITPCLGQELVEWLSSAKEAPKPFNPKCFDRNHEKWTGWLKEKMIANEIDNADFDLCLDEFDGKDLAGLVDPFFAKLKAKYAGE